MNSNEQVKKEMAKIIMKKCQYKNCYREIGDALFEKGNVKKVIKDMKFELPAGGQIYLRNGKPIDQEKQLNEMKIILNERNPKKKSRFISLFNDWWTAITPAQAKNFIRKQSKEVLYTIFMKPTLRNSNLRFERTKPTYFENLFMSDRLRLVNKIGNKLKKEKEQEDLIKSILLHKGKSQGKELLNVFNDVLLKNHSEKRKKLRNLLKKAGERSGNKFKYEPWQISEMIKEIK